jgi:hypothetical protein
VHDVDGPHVPLGVHVCIALFPEHWVAPWEHEPSQDADVPLSTAVQVELVHGIAVPHVPVASHVCTPFPEHCVCPVSHVPAHLLSTHD